MRQPSDPCLPAAEARLPKLMGILNLTPDSFYDGGRYLAEQGCRQKIDALVTEGADIIDIGGESTRPGAAPVAAQEQIRRIEAAVRYAVSLGIEVSIDTANTDVAESGLALGAQIVNDVSCLANPSLARVVAQHRATLVLMHSRESMTQMEGFSKYPEYGYSDVVEDVRREWRQARDRAVDAGVPVNDIWFDPGIGFHKSARHSLALLGRLASFGDEGVPIVVGASRKSFIAEVDGTPPEERLGGSIAACILAMQHGASVLRVHDVKQTRQALLLTRAMEAMGARHA